MNELNPWASDQSNNYLYVKRLLVCFLLQLRCAAISVIVENSFSSTDSIEEEEKEE